MTVFAWAEIAIVAGFAATLGLKIASQRRRGLPAIVMERRPERPTWLEPLMVGALFGWFGSVLVHALALAPGLFRPNRIGAWQRELGVFLAAASLALLGGAFLHLGASWRIGIDRERTGPLVTRGVFGVSRNPIFTALIGVAIALMLLTGSWFYVATGVFVAFGVHGQVLREEAFLEERFGEAYRSYRARVPRYVGLTRPS